MGMDIRRQGNMEIWKNGDIVGMETSNGKRKPR
jgi:hypothetical protein